MKNKIKNRSTEIGLPIEYMGLVLENAHEAIMIIQDEKYIYLNQKSAEIYGYSSEEMCKKHINEIVHPEDYEKVKASYYKRLGGEIVERYSYRILDANCYIKWVEISGLKILWKGKPAVLNFMSDITRRATAEKALQRSEKQLSDIINFLPDAMFAIDCKGCVIEWNREMENLSGIKNADMIGKGDFEYALPFYGKRKPMLIDLIINPNIPTDQDYTYYEKSERRICAEISIERDDTTLFFWTEASLMVDYDKNIIGAIELIRDITEMRNVYVELEKKTVLLEEKNTALRVLLKQRENDKKEIEHNLLRNIKETVYPYLEKVKATKLNETQETYLSIAEEHLSEMLSPFLLNMTKITLGLTPREIEIAALVKDGKTTKEIANILNIAINTINNHRRRLRKKLGLKRKDENLHSYLLSLKE